jgi:hypothetical protein
MVVGDDTDASALAQVTGTTPDHSSYGLVVRPVTAAQSASLGQGVTWVHQLTTTIVKSTPGYLSHIIINNPGDTGNVAAIWDGDPNNGGTQFASLNLSVNPTTLNYSLNFSSGLYIVTSGPLGSECGDITVVFN